MNNIYKEHPFNDIWMDDIIRREEKRLDRELLKECRKAMSERRANKTVLKALTPKRFWR